MTVYFVMLDMVGQFVAVHLGHHDIRYHNIEFVGLDESKSFASIAGCQHVIARLQQSFHQSKEFDIVFHYQHARSICIGGRYNFLWHTFSLWQVCNAALQIGYLHLVLLINLRRSERILVDRDFKGEGGASSFLTFTFDATTHIINKIARESQS